MLLISSCVLRQYSVCFCVCFALLNTIAPSTALFSLSSMFTSAHHFWLCRLSRGRHSNTACPENTRFTPLTFFHTPFLVLYMLPPPRFCCTKRVSLRRVVLHSVSLLSSALFRVYRMPLFACYLPSPSFGFNHPRFLKA